MPEELPLPHLIQEPPPPEEREDREAEVALPTPVALSATTPTPLLMPMQMELLSQPVHQVKTEEQPEQQETDQPEDHLMWEPWERREEVEESGVPLMLPELQDSTHQQSLIVIARQAQLQPPEVMQETERVEELAEREDRVPLAEQEGWGEQEVLMQQVLAVDS